jgi:hypothetical protein
VAFGVENRHVVSVLSGVRGKGSAEWAEKISATCGLRPSFSDFETDGASAA